MNKCILKEDLMPPYPSNIDVYQLQQTLTAMRIQNWLGEDLFSSQWWLLLGILIIPWIIWYRLVDRTRIFELRFLNRDCIGAG